MALKKTIAAYLRRWKEEIKTPSGEIIFEEKKEWIEQKDIEMHPLEESAIRAHWNIHDVKMKIPLQPNQQQEHDWLIDYGAEYVKSKRKEWQKIHDSIQPEIVLAHMVHEAAHNEWIKHAELCVANGLDPDIQIDGRNLTLPKKEKI